MAKTNIAVSFECPECGIPIKCTRDNWRTLCCQNCGESISEKDLQNALTKIKSDKGVTDAQRSAAQEILIELAINSGNYSILSGTDWTYLLQSSNSYVAVCNWSCLTGGNWKDLLSSNPEYAEYCGLTINSDKTYWKKISPNQWNCIITTQPQFLFINDLINGRNVAAHLREYPWAEKFCEWNSVSGHEWCKILTLLSEKYSRCSWDKLDGHDWVELLSIKPEFAPFCNWNLIDDSGFGYLQRNAEALKKHLDFSKLPRESFYQIIEKMNWGDLCDWSHISSSLEWREILKRHPGLAPYCNFSMFTTHDWAALLSQQPGLKKGCPWERLDKNDWAELLSAQPDMIVYYPVNFKNIWNYQDFAHRSSLCLQMSRLFVFYSSLSFLALFSFISLWGETGWFSLLRESFTHSAFSGVLWIGFAFAWAYFYAKLWSGDYNRWIQLVSSFFISISIYTVYSWTFFFSRCSFGIFCLTIFFVGILILPVFSWFRHKRHILLSSPLLLILTVMILLPAVPGDYYKIGKSLSKKPLTFLSASRVYFEKGCSADPKFKELSTKITECLEANKWRDAKGHLDSILLLNPFYPKKDSIAKKIEEIRLEEAARIAEELRKNTAEAKKLFRAKKYSSAYQVALKSSQQDTEILLILAWLNENGIGTQKDLSGACGLYLRAAKTGDKIAQYKYAQFLERNKNFQGKEHDRNPVTWYSAAANANYIPACVRLSEIFASGLYGEEDLDKALNLVYTHANTDALAARQLARVHVRLKNQFEAERNYNTMMLLLLHSAEKGDAEALYHLGESFAQGEGCDRNSQVSFRFYERSFSLGYKSSALPLAKALEHGLGTKRDYPEAMRYYQVAAAQGDLTATLALGRFYMYGLGCEKSESLAKDWLMKAVEHKNPDAAGYLASLFYYGSFSVKDLREAHKYAHFAAENGNALGQFIMGNFYTFGRGGVTPDKATAFRWYLKAAEQNHPDAQYNVGYMYENGDAGTIDLAEAKKWYSKAAANGNQRAKNKLK